MECVVTVSFLFLKDGCVPSAWAATSPNARRWSQGAWWPTVQGSLKPEDTSFFTHIRHSCPTSGQVSQWLKRLENTALDGSVASLRMFLHPGNQEGETLLVAKRSRKEIRTR